MEIRAAAIPDVPSIAPAGRGARRGFLSEVAGTVRGLHHRIAPMARARLLRVIRGAILEVAVDLRRRSPTFGRHVAAVISAAAWTQIFVPVGFAHGFRTLTPDAGVLYRLGNCHPPEHERGLAWDDAALAIARPATAKAIPPERGRGNPRLSDLTDPFRASMA